MLANARLLIATALALGLATSARAELKIGYVDLQRALTEVDEGRAARARLQALLDARQKELDREQEDLRWEKELLDKQATALSEATRVDRQTVLQKKLYDLAQRAEKGQKELQNRERAEMSGIFQKMDVIVAQIAQREELTLVLDRGTVVYGPASLDITNELVRLYNDKYKADSKPGLRPRPPEGTPKKDG